MSFRFFIIIQIMRLHFRIYIVFRLHVRILLVERRGFQRVAMRMVSARRINRLRNTRCVAKFLCLLIKKTDASHSAYIFKIPLFMYIGLRTSE